MATQKRLPEDDGPRKTGWSEEFEIVGGKLVDKVKELLQEGNVRRLIIRNPDGNVLFEIPLTAGVAVGGILAFTAPILASIGAMAALIANFKVEVIRTDGEPEDDDEEPEPRQIKKD